MTLGPHWYVLSREPDEPGWHIHKDLEKTQAESLAQSLRANPQKRVVVGFGQVFW